MGCARRGLGDKPDEEEYHPDSIEQRQLAGMNEYTVTDIENAINYWRSRQAATDDFAVCPRAGVLADVYGTMIYHRRERVEARHLTAEQNEAIGLALAQKELF
ncbi:DUF3717 domain-containing protein [Caballeronia sp. INML2]|jgi:hypothetical protein|uniref:DUF3717 domain-containing protein n=1 Tax=Caballeronia sp. INML2 TaxID=2921748 RepID=UPI00202864ED|nr:DUF3717 domain-containing protein [Caballeronia sp. INML2]